MSLRSDLESARASIVAELKSMDHSKRTYAAGGQSENWDAHRSSLIESMMKINEALSRGGDNLDQAWEEHGIGIT